jgi:hypothetical protein
MYAWNNALEIIETRYNAAELLDTTPDNNLETNQRRKLLQVLLDAMARLPRQIARPNRLILDHRWQEMTQWDSV